MDNETDNSNEQVYCKIFSLGEQIAALEQKKTRLLAALGNTLYEKNNSRQELLMEEINQVEKEISSKTDEMEGLENEI